MNKKQILSEVKELQAKIAELQMPIQEEIEDRVQEQKEQTIVPEETRSAEDLEKSIEVVGKIAKKLFSKKAELTEPQKDLVVNKLNEVGETLIESEEEQISDIGVELLSFDEEELEDVQVASRRVASIAKKLIVASETMEDETFMEADEDEDEYEDDEEETEEIEKEQKLAVAQELVKIASLLKQKKHELTAKQSLALNKKLVKLSDRIAAFGDEEFSVSKSDVMQDFQKSNRYLDKRLMNCVDWDELKNKSTSRMIKPSTQLKDITLEDLRKIMTTLRGI